MARDANHALFADLSNNNRYFNAARYRRAGHRLVALKASEGDGFVDERHARWSAEAHHAGLAVVHYCYCTPGRGSGRAAAELFWSVVDRHFIPGRDRLALDMEVFGPPGTVSAYLAEADGRLGALAGDAPANRPVGYTYRAFFEAHTPVLRSRCWWIADYGDRLHLGSDLGSDQRLWAQQFTDGTSGAGPHSVRGVAGPCDVSALNAESLRHIERALG